MVVEINLLKNKHGILAHYEKSGGTEAVGALHKKRTFSILIITVLLAVLVGLQFGEKLFFPIQEPLIKSLDYTLQLIPKLMQEMKDAGKQTPEEEVVTVDDFNSMLVEGMKKTPEQEAALAPEEKAALETAPTPDPMKPLEEEKPKEQPIVPPQPAVVESKPEPQPMPTEKASPQKAKKPEPSVPVAETKQPVAQPHPEPKPEPKAEPKPEPKPEPKQEAAQSVQNGTGVYLNAGSYVLEDNIVKLESAGKKLGFSLKVEKLERELPSYSLLIGHLEVEEKVAVVERDLKKRKIAYEMVRNEDGTYDFLTKETALKKEMEEQRKLLSGAGYVVKPITKNKKTVLNRILVGPLAKDKVSEVSSYLKKNGFPAQVFK